MSAFGCLVAKSTLKVGIVRLSVKNKFIFLTLSMR
jgi:hypothetical protein